LLDLYTQTALYLRKIEPASSRDIATFNKAEIPDIVLSITNETRTFRNLQVAKPSLREERQQQRSSARQSVKKLAGAFEGKKQASEMFKAYLS